MSNHLDRIVKEYSKLSFNNRKDLRTVYYNKMEYYAKNNNISIPIHITFLENYFTIPRNIQKNLSNYSRIEEFFKKIFIPMSQKESSEKYYKDNILQAMLYECIESLRRSIFWFINYRYNNRIGFLIPARQSRYYSEFFGFISLSRFLGIALTRFPIIKTIETTINWEKMKIEIKKGKAKGGMHKAHFQLLKRDIEKNNFIPDNIKEEIKRQDNLFLTEERSSMIYAFGNEGRVSFEELIKYKKSNITNQLSHCFLGGENGEGYYIIRQMRIQIQQQLQTKSYYHMVMKDIKNIL